jgi:NAD(P)-dependent dehydrogenase (short-subunit alcohol dehydrogenase family)
MKQGRSKGGFFEDRVALITGSSRGIGKATALLLARSGAKVVINGRNQDKLSQAGTELEAAGGTVLAVPGDVTDPQECRRIAERTIEVFGRLDFLINNAGISMRGRFEDVEPQVVKQVVELNLLGAAYMTRYALPLVRDTKGSVVFVSSLAGLIRGVPNISVYAFSKMALTGLVESLRVEMNGTGVHFGIVYAGLTEYDPDKVTLDAEGNLVPISRKSHSTKEQVAGSIIRMLKRRRRRMVLTLAGKLGVLGQSLMPRLVGFGMALSQRSNPLYR